MVRSMQASKSTLDEKLDQAGMRMFGAAPIMKGGKGLDDVESAGEEDDDDEVRGGGG
jgi:hypothetical protein